LNFELDFIVVSAMATTILNWIRDDLDEPRLLIRFVGDPSFLEIERGDILELDTTETFLNNNLLGLVSAGDQFRVIEKLYVGSKNYGVKPTETIEP